MAAMVDNLAMRIPSSYCLACHFKRRRESENNTTALVFDPGTEAYTLKRLEDIDGESTVIPSLVPVLTARTVEKAIYRDFLPYSAQSIKVQHSGATKSLADVVDNACWSRRSKHQRGPSSLVDGFYIMPGITATQTTIITRDPLEHQLAELPAPESFNQNQSPVELPADDDNSPVAPQPLFHPASPTPLLLLPPRPRSPTARKASPLLAPFPPFPPPPPTRDDGGPEHRHSYASSVGSASIQIAYEPSQHDGADREEEEPWPLKVSAPSRSSSRIG
ncbi:MAG: hypothetical protein ASARMPRED_002695 [Alectoria sarmentosa]|nr:MAG: hypothetical protein ASARMPRED_002695 [Alectoria sarmentosa]